MSRLTKKGVIYPSSVKTTGGLDMRTIKFSDEFVSQMYDKLRDYEDLEEELGCPLEVVFKALDKGFYVDTKKIEKNPAWENPKPRYMEIGCTKYFRLNLWYKTIEVDRYNNYLEINLNDYKKTWWLKEDKSE